MPWYFTLPLAVALLVVPFLLGGYLARRWRMPDYGWKIGLTLALMAASLWIVYDRWPPKLGIDLSGGVILVYEVDQAKKSESGQAVDMEKLIASISRRVNPGGQKEVTIRQYGQEQIEIIIPNATEAEVGQIERIISKAGTLEFRILANRQDHPSLIERALADPRSKSVRDSAGEIEAYWVPVERGQESSFAGYDEIAVRRGQKESDPLEILVVDDAYDVTGGYLVNASPSIDQRARPSVSFAFNSLGAQLFGRLTGEHLPDQATQFSRKLGIILDSNLYSAPAIQSTIYDRGEITGSFDQAEVDALVNVLNAGSLPAALTAEPISRLYSGPTLGRDTIEKSGDAMTVSAVLVLVFMLWYYRFAGLVANIALSLNILTLVAAMILIKAPFTLPGLAGVALTVGMAVDNNVLVYERLREELDRGASLRMAIRNAFQRATAVIVDANLTTIIAATVLYVIGTDQVKGFAVTLWIGVAISMFTAVFVARIIFDVAERQGWIKQLKMMRVIGKTNVDFMRVFPITATISVVVIVASLLTAFLRGRGLFDIDFTGGVSVQAYFREPQDVGDIRRALAKRAELPDLAVSDVKLANEQGGLRFVVNTSQGSQDEVERVIKEEFGPQLQTNEMKVSGLSEITATSVAKGEPSSGEAPKMQAPAGDAPAKTAPAEPAEKSPPAPAEKKQSRADWRHGLLLASNDTSPLWLGQVLAQTKADPKPEAKAEAKPEAKAEAKPEAKAVAKPEAAPVAKPQAKAEAKPEAKAEVKPEAKSEAKPDSAPAAKPAAKPEAAPVAPPAPSPEAKPAEKPAFLGGTKARLQFGIAVNYQTLQELLEAGVQSIGRRPDQVPLDLTNDRYERGASASFDTWDVQIQLPPADANRVFQAVEKRLASEPFFPASSAIGGAVASGTRWKAVYALVASWLCIILYVWVRFQRVAFGLAAVLALVHDVLVILGALAISYYVADYLGFLGIDPFKINLPIVAAFLTIIGYSVNDTIVVFDRLRELRGKDPNMTAAMVNQATNETMSRTLLTAFTVLLVVLTLYLFGGEAIHGFAFALIVGVVTGTYSTVYVAAPMLLWMIGTKKKG